MNSPLRFKPWINQYVLVCEYVCAPRGLKGEVFVFDSGTVDSATAQKAFYYLALHKISCQLPAAVNKQIGWAQL